MTAEVSADDVSITCNSGLFCQHAVHPYTVDQNHSYEIIGGIQSLGDCEVLPGSVILHYRSDGGSFTELPMLETGNPDEWSAGIPPHPVPTVLEYYLSAEDNQGGNCASPRNAPFLLHYFRVDNDFSNAMELDGAWSVGAQNDNALTGVWTRADPVGTQYNNNQVQPEDDHSSFPGTNCFLTGNGVVGEAAGVNDVDGGKTTLLSPVYDLRGGSDISIGYWRWYTNNLGNSPNEDYWTVEISNDGGQSWSVIEHSTASNNAWQQVNLEFDDYFSIPGLVQLRFIAEDVGDGSLVEAAVDDFSLVGFFDDLTNAAGGTALDFSVDLGQNCPNPFNPRTEILFRLGADSPARLEIFDAGGHRVRVLIAGPLAKGEHRVVWDGNDQRGRPVSSGIYLYRLVTRDQILSRRMVLIK